MLQNYLNANLLFLTDDGDLKKLHKTSEEIGKKLLKNRLKIISYTLSAIDPDVSANNTDIVEVKNAIIGNWNTFAANTKDTPLTYIRAVIFEALNKIAADINIAALISFAGRNVVNFYKLTGEEKRIVLGFLSHLGNRINKEANSTWSFSNTDYLPNASIELKEASKYLINDDSLRKYLEDAAGPTKNFDSPNPEWPDSGEAWVIEFGPRAAKGIKTITDLSLKAIANTLNDNLKIIQNALNRTEESGKEMSESSRSLQLRSELLWWKEACYSPSVDKGYREITEEVLEIVIAGDYASFVPIIYPRSVDYFLKETYRNLKSESEQEVEVGELIKLYVNKSEQLRQVLPEFDQESGKVTLLNYLSGVVWGRYKLNQLEHLLGFSADIKISRSNMTLWLFHDFQLLKGLNSK